MLVVAANVLDQLRVTERVAGAAELESTQKYWHPLKAVDGKSSVTRVVTNRSVVPLG